MKPRALLIGVPVVALAVAVGAWVSVTKPKPPVYVTVPVVTGTIQQTLTASGTIDRPGRHEVTFDSAGTVTGVAVRVGDPVRKGQPLASTDSSPLRVSLLQAQAQTAQARAALDADTVAKDSGASAASPPTIAVTGSGGLDVPQPTTAPTAAGAPSTPPYLEALQGSLARLQAAAATQQTACQPVTALIGTLQGLQSALPTTASAGSPASPPSTPPARSRPSPTPDPTPDTTSSPATSAVSNASLSEAKRAAKQIAACTSAMVALAAAEQDAGQAITAAATRLQQATAAAQAQLAAAQAQMVAAAQAAAKQAAAQAMAQAQAQLAAQAQRALAGQVTEATLAADRVRVLQAEQSVERAQRALDGATITSPVDGTVGAVGLVAGESSAGRSVSVVGAGAAEVRIEVPLAQRALVTTGLQASVGLVGADRDLDGRVTSVSALPSSSSGPPTYQAVITVDDPGMVLKPGAKAEVELPLRTAAGVISVPMSAVTKVTDTTATVEIVSDPSASSTELVSVTTGATGGGRIEVTSGLTPGQLVVVADRRLPVPGGLSQYQPASASASPTPTRTR